MIRPYCIRCGMELNEPGAVLLSPPADWSSFVDKQHLCKDCWLDLDEWVKRGKPKPEAIG